MLKKSNVLILSKKINRMLKESLLSIRLWPKKVSYIPIKTFPSSMKKLTGLKVEMMRRRKSELLIVVNSSKEYQRTGTWLRNTAKLTW